MMWGWIPTLSPDSMVRRPVRLPAEGIAIEDGMRILPSADGYTVEADDGEVIDVHIINGLVAFEMLGDDLSDVAQPTEADRDESVTRFMGQHVYDVIKGLHHEDVTHGPKSGLACVEADDFRQALLAILNQFEIVNEWKDVEGRYNGPPPRARTIVRSIGLMKYGLSFLDAYSEYIPADIVDRRREYLQSNLEFLDDMSHYIHDEYSGRMEKSNHALNRSVVWMTCVVIALTWTSAVFGSYSALEATGLFDEIDTWWVILVAVVPSVIYLVIKWYGAHGRK